MSLSENSDRNEGKLGLGLFFAFLRRIVALFDEKKRKMAQIQLFCSRFSILGQAPRVRIYKASKIPAAPMPVPIHMVTMPYFPPVLRKP